MRRNVKQLRYLGMLGAIMLFLCLPSTAVAAAIPRARIAQVIYPERVTPGNPFDVLIVVDYSNEFLADVALWDSDSSLMIRSRTLISGMTGPGQADFTFQLTAPQSDGVWHLVAWTRVWWENAWYSDPDGGTFPFAVSISKKVTLKLNIPGNRVTIRVDDTDYATDGTKPLTVSLASGSHSLEAPQFLQGRPGVERYVFKGWSDGVNSTRRSILVVEDATLTLNYRREYFLFIQSTDGRTSGEGWYEAGSRVSVAAIPAYKDSSLNGLVTLEHHFSGWSGDLKSKESSTSLIIDGPKTIKAEWAVAETWVNPVIPIIMTLGSLILAVRIVHVRTRRTYIENLIDRSTSSEICCLKSCLGLVLVFILCASNSLAAVSTPAFAIAQPLSSMPQARTVRIGDASWYYWNRTLTDTCILWLGGGVSQDSESHYWINPYNYESYGTIHFLQDLGNYYCVIALAKGSTEVLNANRLIYQEAYRPESTIIADVHNWIKQRGYEHTFLVGYSVGGQAAAVEATVRDPEGWTSGDGLILITTPLSARVIDRSKNLHNNLLLAYGGNLPDFVESGKTFFTNAPEEGWNHSYHKEFHVLDDVGHEIWTVRKTGEYTPRAINLVASFIERSKGAQIDPHRFSSSLNRSSFSLSIASVSAPDKVLTGELFFVNATIQFSGSMRTEAALLASDTNRNMTLTSSHLTLTKNGQTHVRLIIPSSSNPSDLSLSVSLFQRSGQSWVLVSTAHRKTVRVTELASLTLLTSAPNLPFTFDGKPYKTAITGKAQLDVRRGHHSLQLQPVVFQDNTTRMIFTMWEDSSLSPLRQINIQDNTTMIASYRTQHFVNATSPHGSAEGSGWYDENSSTAVMVQQPIVKGAIFAYWEGSRNRSPRVIIQVDSPKTLRAHWDPWNEPTSDGISVLWTAFSILLFISLLTWNLTTTRRRGDARL